MASVTFPKIGEKHNLRPLYGAEHTVSKGSSSMPKRAVFIYNNDIRKIMTKELGLYRDSALEKAVMNPEHVLKSRKAKELLVVKLGIGAPLTAVVAEELFSLGVEEILIIGIAGAVKRWLDFGGLIICSKAVRDEGTSHHYLKNGLYSYPDSMLTARLESIMKVLGIGYSKGPTWTIDAPYVETIEEVKHYRGKGIFTVEMEAAALFAVAKKRGRGAAALFTVSDILDPEEGWSGFSDEGKRKRKREAYPKIARVALAYGLNGRR